MASTVRPAVVLLLLLTLLLGVVYPLAVTGVAQVAFPHRANGSLIERNGKLVGSELIGQPFDEPRYFWSRPSATGPAYNGGASTGSNLGPSNPALEEAVKARVQALKGADPGNATPIPIDLVTTSGSGLDPHISAAAALYQTRRVARERGLDVVRVRKLVEAHLQTRLLGVLGEPVVNVLELNLALDALK
jgi:K+-transporting ATPase ATPase C chain